MASREEVLANFQALSGVENLDTAISLLESCDWDLERAVEMSSQGGSAAMDHDGEQRTGAAHSGGAAGGGWLSTAWRVGTSMLGWGWRAGGRGGEQSARTTDSSGEPYSAETARFVSALEKKYGEDHPTMLLGTYAQAVDQAKREFKFLLVYLHANVHENTGPFCSETLFTSTMKDFVDDSFLFWAGSINQADGFNVSNALCASSYPFLAVVAGNGSTMTVIDAHQGPFEREEMMSWLTNILQTHGPELIADRAEVQEREATRALRAQQDLEFQEGLAADRARAREQEEAELAARREEERLQRQEEEREEKEARRRRRRVEAAANVKPEPPEEEGVTAIVAFRLPSGVRLQRRFRKTDQVQCLYDFVEANGELEHDVFHLATHFPKTVFTDTSATLEEAGLHPQAMLFVDSADSDDED